jgi:hypothetical protein
VHRARREIQRLLRDNLSIRPIVEAMITDELPAARNLAAMALAEYNETPAVDPQRLTRNALGTELRVKSEC